jgi:acyl-CoA synthetase (AMP-forming)/AMP-acid ligase II
VPKPGRTPDKDDIIAFMGTRIAKWQLPDDVVFVEEIPHTATGKIQKTSLRERFRHYRLPGA